jgi:hypothetical protein
MVVVIRKITTTAVFITSAFGDERRQILKTIQRFGKYCNCHLQGEYVVVWRFWKPYIRQSAVRSSSSPFSIIKTISPPTAFPI